MIDKRKYKWEQLAQYVQRGLLQWEMLRGEKIMHIKLGYGVVSETDGKYLYVVFDGVQRGPFSISANYRGDYFPFVEVSEKLQKLVDEAILHALKTAEEQREQQNLEAQKAQKQRQALSVIEPFEWSVDLASSDAINAQLLAPPLDPEDIQLAKEWLRPKQSWQRSELSTERNYSTREVTKENWELGRLFSARVAEKAVMRFFQQSGYRVEDISIRQIRTPSNRDWERFDLLINDMAVDVKNARRSNKNENTYAEYLVPKFKLQRADVEVLIAGTLSSLLPASVFTSSKSTYDLVTVLGITRLSHLLKAKAEFDKAGRFRMDLRPHSVSGQFLPPWVFDYPQNLYEQRKRALEQFVEYVQSTAPEFWKRVEFEIGYDKTLRLIPLFVASGTALPGHWCEDRLAVWEQEFIQRIHVWRERVGLSLPFLFLSILTHFLEMVSMSGLDQLENYDPLKYKRLIFAADNSHPLFMLDPLETINSLISTLSTLWNKNRALVRRYRLFKLQGLNILQGRTNEEDEMWKTIIAYCGGRTSDNKHCGKNPLILGEAELCAECGKLICPDCGFCSETCSLRRPQ